MLFLILADSYMDDGMDLESEACKWIVATDRICYTVGGFSWWFNNSHYNKDESNSRYYSNHVPLKVFSLLSRTHGYSRFRVFVDYYDQEQSVPYIDLVNAYAAACRQGWEPEIFEVGSHSQV